MIISITLVMLMINCSGGRLGEEGPPEDGAQCPIFFSNPDVLFANEYPVARFGQGAFAAALETLHQLASFILSESTSPGFSGASEGFECLWLESLQLLPPIPP